MKNTDLGYGICIFPNCGKFAKTRKHQLCGGHDSQMRAGKPLTEIREFSISDIGIEGWRRCTKCDEVKKVDSFYQRANGQYQSHCKVCMIQDNTAYNRRRKAAQEAVSAH